MNIRMLSSMPPDRLRWLLAAGCVAVVFLLGFALSGSGRAGAGSAPYAVQAIELPELGTGLNELAGALGEYGHWEADVERQQEAVTAQNLHKHLLLVGISSTAARSEALFILHTGERLDEIKDELELLNITPDGRVRVAQDSEITPYIRVTDIGTEEVHLSVNGELRVKHLYDTGFSETES